MAEIIPIVDENDHIIGSIEKANFDKSTGQIYRTVSLFLFDKQGRMLIQRRADSKATYAGKWDFAAVAGHVGFGESYLQTIQRETEEEIGLSGVNFHAADKEFTQTPEGKRRFTQIYWAVEDFSLDDLIIPEHEVAEVRLVTIAELKRMFEQNPAQFANYDGADNFAKMAERLKNIAVQMNRA